jgi:hypothetical protein
MASALIVAVSTAVAFSGTWVNYFEYANWVKWHVLANAKDFAARGITSAYQLFLFDFRYAPIGAYWTFPRKDSYFVFDAMRQPGLVLALYVAFAIGFATGMTFLWRAIRQTAPSRNLYSRSTMNDSAR